MFDCTICSQELKNWDELASTTCGHVFHQHCLNAWIINRGECPQCHTLRPETHKIFLNFDRVQRQMSSADESHAVEVSRLESQLEQNEKTCFELQEKLEFLRAQHDSIEQANMSKSTKIQNLHDQLESLQEHLLLQTAANEELQKALDERESHMISNMAQYEKIEQENLLKSTEIDRVQVKLKSLEDKLLIITAENEKLHNVLKGRDSQNVSYVAKIADLTEKVRQLSETSIRQNHIVEDFPVACQTTEMFAQLQQECTELKQRLKCEFEEKIMLFEQKNTLEEKLKQIQFELHREIRHSTKISVDRMRLVSMMEQTTVAGGRAKDEDTYQEVAWNRLPEKEDDITADTTTVKSISNGVIILGLNGSFAPRETVLKLAQQMRVCVVADDIDNTVVNRLYKNTALIVGFKTKACKDRILAEAGKLKYYQETQHIEVCDYSPATDLLAYAKKLKSVGYKNVYINKELVFARVDRKSTPIAIFNKERVDKLMQLPTKSGTVRIVDAPKPNDRPKPPDEPHLHWSNANEAFDWDNRYCIPTFTT